MTSRVKCRTCFSNPSPNCENSLNRLTSDFIPKNCKIFELRNNFWCNLFSTENNLRNLSHLRFVWAEIFPAKIRASGIIFHKKKNASIFFSVFENFTLFRIKFESYHTSLRIGWLILRKRSPNFEMTKLSLKYSGFRSNIIS